MSSWRISSRHCRAVERTDFDILCQSAGVDGARLEGDIQRAIDKLPHGAGAVEEFSDHIFHAIREAWTLWQDGA